MSDNERHNQVSINRRAALLGSLGAGVFGVLSSRLYYLQILKAEDYRALSDDNRFNFNITIPSRGRILDRYGNELAINSQNFSLVLIPERVKDIEATLLKLKKILSLSTSNITRIKKNISKHASFVPVLIKENLDWGTFSKLNFKTPDFPGVIPQVGLGRSYPNDGLFSHTIGYVGSPSPIDLEDDKDPLLKQPSFKIGKTGIESSADKLLRGSSGKLKVEVNASGRTVREFPNSNDAPINGQDIWLTLDSELTTSSGEVVTGDYIFDARGFTSDDSRKIGIQKFYGKTIETIDPHNLKYPVIMDATVSQYDGYRFIYCLPFSKNQILIEDTYYSDGFNFDQAKYNKRIDEYIEANNWTEHKVIRVEKGVLPITLAVDSKLVGKRGVKYNEPIEIGMRGNFYHPVTGYSFPEAVRLASKISRTINSCDQNKLVNLDLEIRKYKLLLHRRNNFFRLLNRLLFRASLPSKRHLVLQRFYTLSENLIKRFYEGNIHKKDILRILIGKPPVPVLKAIYFFSEAAFVAREKSQREKNEKK